MGICCYSKVGDEVEAGDIIGTVQETPVVTERLWFLMEFKEL